MARLPQPGGDNGTWGQLLNDFLSVAHASDGTIIPSSGIPDNSVAGTKLQNSTVTNTQLLSGSGSDGQVLTKDAAALGGFAWTSVAGSPDATSGTKGLIRLTGDLGGTADSPTVPGLAGAEQTANKGVANGYASLNASVRVPSAQLGAGTADNTTYLRGDGVWIAAPVISVAGKVGAVTLVKDDVGLANVDNTSDASKPVSTAQQTALNGKVNTTNGGGETYFDAGNSGTAITLNLANGNVQKLTLTGNCTITLTSPASGAYRSMLIFVFQDGVGSRTITWPGSVRWGTAGAPTLSTIAGRMDKILLDTVDGGTTWYGSVGPGGF